MQKIIVLLILLMLLFIVNNKKINYFDYLLSIEITVISYLIVIF